MSVVPIGVALVGDVLTSAEGFAPRADFTNNVAELGAILHALTLLDEPSDVTIVTDSKYVADGFVSWSHGVKRDRANARLFGEIARRSEKRKLTIEWERGGSTAQNRAAHQTARDAALPYMPAATVAKIRAWEASTRETTLYRWLTGAGHAK